MKRGPAAVLAALFLAVLPQTAHGQTVVGQLSDSGSGAPLEGALVLLLNEAGEEVGGYLTNDAGRFLIRAPGPGTYTLRSERIGYETTTSDPFTLERGQQFGIRLESAEKAIELEEITVEGDQQCVVRPGEGLQLAAIWEEARKALTVQDWAEREGMYRFRISNYERHLDADARVVQSETRRNESGVSGSPIRSLPVEELLSQGFIRDDGSGGYDYFGPDASVLLSDPFLDTHCFSLKVDPRRPGELGLAFEPVDLKGPPDISGTLWLEGATAELKDLEYWYEWSPWDSARGAARGRVAFERLPNGTWVIRNWWIRMPEMGISPRFRTSDTDRFFVSGIKEVGGEITQYTSLDRSVTSEIARGVLEGRVWDSMGQVPLPGATVFLSGTSYAGETDAEGSFLITDLPPGVFTVLYTHPRLDSLGLNARGVQVEIRSGEFSRVDLGVPTQAEILDSSCSQEELDQGTGVVMGFVREGRTGAPIAGAEVTVEWNVFGGSPEALLRVGSYELKTTSDATGRYVACGVPSGTRLTIRAALGDLRMEPVVVHSTEDGYTTANLIVSG